MMRHEDQSGLGEVVVPQESRLRGKRLPQCIAKGAELLHPVLGRLAVHMVVAPLPRERMGEENEAFGVPYQRRHEVTRESLFDVLGHFATPDGIEAAPGETRPAYEVMNDELTLGQEPASLPASVQAKDLTAQAPEMAHRMAFATADIKDGPNPKVGHHPVPELRVVCLRVAASSEAAQMPIFNKRAQLQPLRRSVWQPVVLKPAGP